MSFDTAEQLSLPFFVSTDTTSHYANVSAEGRGAVFTRREVVDFILDLAGYTADRPLHEFHILEPSFGEGDFLLPIVERLLTAYLSRGSGPTGMAEDLANAICAVEVHQESINKTREKITELFSTHGVPEEATCRLLDQWIIAGDFLLVALPHQFTHIAGNPPYVRQEMIPDTLMAEYRARYSTIYDRADLYIPFFERCLNSLKSKGALGFICADRWMKNKYGGPLRAMIARHYHLACYIDMVNTPAFNAEVIAYPAITLIRREKPGPTRLMHRPEIMAETLNKLARDMTAKTIPEDSGVVEVADVASSSEPWILQSLDQLAVVRRLEADFPLLEETGCKVGIGVATGADRVFIGPYEDLDVEPERKLPLVTTRDIETGSVQWKGLGVINPFNDNGTVADLEDYPRFAKYVNIHLDIIKNRNCAKKKSPWLVSYD